MEEPDHAYHHVYQLFHKLSSTHGWNKQRYQQALNDGLLTNERPLMLPIHAVGDVVPSQVTASIVDSSLHLSSPPFSPPPPPRVMVTGRSTRRQQRVYEATPDQTPQQPPPPAPIDEEASPGSGSKDIIGLASAFDEVKIQDENSSLSSPGAQSPPSCEVSSPVSVVVLQDISNTSVRGRLSFTEAMSPGGAARKSIVPPSPLKEADMSADEDEPIIRKKKGSNRRRIIESDEDEDAYEAPEPLPPVDVSSSLLQAPLASLDDELESEPGSTPVSSSVEVASSNENEIMPAVPESDLDDEMDTPGEPENEPESIEHQAVVNASASIEQAESKDQEWIPDPPSEVYEDFNYELSEDLINQQLDAEESSSDLDESVFRPKRNKDKKKRRIVISDDDEDDETSVQAEIQEEVHLDVSSPLDIGEDPEAEHELDDHEEESKTSDESEESDDDDISPIKPKRATGKKRIVISEDEEEAEDEDEEAEENDSDGSQAIEVIDEEDGTKEESELSESKYDSNGNSSGDSDSIRKKKSRVHAPLKPTSIKPSKKHLRKKHHALIDPTDAYESEDLDFIASEDDDDEEDDEDDEDALSDEEDKKHKTKGGKNVKSKEKPAMSRATFVRQRQSLLEQTYSEFNQRIFCGRLPTIPLIWSKTLRETAGRCFHRGVTVIKIEMSIKVCDDETKMRETLVHEMCHAAVRCIDRATNAPAHGSQFKQWGRKVTRTIPSLGVVERCHHYQIFKKFQYKCNNSWCGLVIGRHSASIDISTKVCGRCKGQLTLTRLNPDGTPAKERTASGFALYVKEHYAETVARNPTTPRKDIMSLVASSYKAVKSAAACSMSTMIEELEQQMQALEA